MADTGDVTRWIEALKNKDEQAVAKLWNVCFQKMVWVAKRKLSGYKVRDSNEEDVALSAFHSFYKMVANDRIPKLEDSEDFWKVLMTITVRKSYAHIKRQLTVKRGGGTTRGESVFAKAGGVDQPIGLDRFAASDPTPVLADRVADMCVELLGGLDDDLRKVAEMKVEGYTREEIAEKLGISTRAVTRKLGVIRQQWQEAEGD